MSLMTLCARVAHVATLAKLRPRRARAYLMIEIVMGGAIVAIVLASTFAIIGSSRREISTTANRQVAASLARTKADELRGEAQTLLPLTTLADVGASYPGFKWQWSVTQSGLTSSSTPALGNDDKLHLITVNVQYPEASAPRTITFKTYRDER